ncbi:MAG: tRNA lysidine(34) synthetase TilS [Alphaproteobacteria bacterium GM202ARS2]|nr:tRNA lysidine(34) synthetase TilS [Alphaproteobacteria bacterium GM202ARS2]
MAENEQIDSALFSRLMGSFAPFESRATIAVGVSGGIDSMVLMFLMDEWCRACDFRAVGLIVDHGLRAESAQEARFVAKVLRDRGIDAHILSCPPTPAVTSNKQAWARHHRYTLLDQWCLANDVAHLAVAHHQDDQFETFFLRLARGSGVYGLSAMAAERFLPSVRLLRPLLSIERARLVATAQRLSLTDRLVCDPSNTDGHYARTRIRQHIDGLAQEGLSPKRLSRTISALARARATLEKQLCQWTEQFVRVYPSGYSRLLQGALNSDDEVRLQGLGRVLRMISGTLFMPRLTRLQRLDNTLRTSPTLTTLTLHGCLVRGDSRQGWLVMREPAHAYDYATQQTTHNKKVLLWDGRFKVVTPQGDSPQGGLVCRALQEEGRLIIRKNKASARHLNPNVPAQVYRSHPSLWQQDQLKVAFNAEGQGFYVDDGKPCQASMTFCPICSMT